MKYIVIELQVQDGTVANIVTAHDNLQQARAKYHSVLSAAAVSLICSAEVFWILLPQLLWAFFCLWHSTEWQKPIFQK